MQARRKTPPSPTGMQTAPSSRTLTAQPVGSTFATITHGLEHATKSLLPTGQFERVSDNFLQMDSGCYRRPPHIPDDDPAWSIEEEDLDLEE